MARMLGKVKVLRNVKVAGKHARSAPAWPAPKQYESNTIENEWMLRNDKVRGASDRWKSAENGGSLAETRDCNVAKE